MGRDNPSTAPQPQLTRAQVRELGLAQLAESGVTEADLGLLKIDFVTAQDIKARRLPVVAAPGILHHYFLPNHQVNGLRRVRYLRGYEPDDPQKPAHKMRYGHPKGAPPELYLVPTMDWETVFRDPSVPLYFTEGWLKAIAAAKILNLPVLAYDGIWSFGKDGVLLPIYNEIVWRGRTVYLLNDADVPEKNLRAENTHARLLMERSVEQVLVCRYPKGCKQGKLDDVLMAKGAKWYTQQVLKKAVAWDPAMTEGEEIPAGLAEEPVRAPMVVSPMPSGAMYGLAKKVAEAFDTPPSLTYPAVLVALASGQLPIQGETRGTLYGVLLNVSGGCKSIITDRVEQLMTNTGLKWVKVLRTLPASDRGLLNMLQLNQNDADLMIPSVLLVLDELKNLLAKANIENSNLYSCLNELFYHTSFSVSDRKGMHESSPVNFNLLGNLPCSNAAQFTELFGHDSQEGFYRRCLFGVGMRAEPFIYRAVGERLKTLLKELHFNATRLRATKEMYERMEMWKQASVGEEQRARRDGLGELILRVALVTSSANGDERVTDKAMDAAVRFIEWQEQIRTVYAPARAKSPYAQCMDMVVNYLEGCKGLMNWRRVCQNEHWHRREFSQHLPAIKRYLLSEGMLIASPQKGLFYYTREEEEPKT